MQDLNAGSTGSEPMVVPMPQAPAVIGMTKSMLYRRAKEGRIRLLKMGRTTLVDMQSVKAFLASLPTL